MKYLLLFKFWLKKFYNLPIYRKDVLEYAKIMHGKYKGLCRDIINTLIWFKIISSKVILDYELRKYFPRFGDNVDNFDGGKRFTFWWSAGIWNTGRLDYLNWLIEEYKDDKTDLRKL